MKNRKQTEKDKKEIEIYHDLVALSRVAKVVKGGRRFSFAAIVVAGDKKGKVGYGLGKAKEVGEARDKAIQAAKRSMMKVNLKSNKTIHHDIIGRSGAGRVVLRSAPPGTGIIAGGPMRTIFDLLGLQDIVSKSIGSNNPHNMIGATFDALSKLTSPRKIAESRSKKVSQIYNSAKKTHEVNEE